MSHWSQENNSVWNIDNSRSYATEDRLHRAISMHFGETARYMTVRNREGRWTAIFPYHGNPNIPAVHIATLGFKVVG